MDLKVLEDFISLAETENFSKAAAKRHVTQPAFSRRIKSLENWFGVTLVDRSHYPTKLTKEGTDLYDVAKKLTNQLYQCREDVRTRNIETSSVLRFAMPHTLSITFFPQWRSTLEKNLGISSINVTTGNIHDSAQLLDSGNCDFVLYFEYINSPASCFHDGEFAKKKVGQDHLVPVSAAKEDGKPLYDLDSDNESLIPYLALGQPTLAHHIITELIGSNQLYSKLFLRYQNQLAPAVREEVLLGNGMAWIPESLVKTDLQNGSLILASSNYSIPIDIYVVKKEATQTPLIQSWWNAIENS